MTGIAWLILLLLSEFQFVNYLPSFGRGDLTCTIALTNTVFSLLLSQVLGDTAAVHIWKCCAELELLCCCHSELSSFMGTNKLVSPLSFKLFYEVILYLMFLFFFKWNLKLYLPRVQNV